MPAMQMLLLGAGGGSAAAALTWDAAQKTADMTLSNGDLTGTNTQNTFAYTLGTLGKSSGKWYFEVTKTSGKVAAGVASSLPSQANYKASGWYGIFSDTGYIVESLAAEGLPSPGNTAWTRIGVAVDLTNLKIHWYNGSVWVNSSDPATNTGGKALSSATYYPCMLTNFFSSANGVGVLVPSGFTYSVPSGFSAWA